MSLNVVAVKRKASPIGTLKLYKRISLVNTVKSSQQLFSSGLSSNAYDSQSTPITPITPKSDSYFESPFPTYTPEDSNLKQHKSQQSSQPINFSGIVESFSKRLLSKSSSRSSLNSPTVSTITSPTSSTHRSSICSMNSPNTSILSIQSPIYIPKYKEYNEVQKDRRLLNSVRIISKFKLDPIVILMSHCCCISTSNELALSKDRMNYINSLTYYIYPNSRISDEEYNKIKQFSGNANSILNTRRYEWKEGLVSLYDNFRQFINTQFYILYSNFVIEFVKDNNKQMVIFSNCTSQMKKQLKALNIIFIEPFHNNNNHNTNNNSNDELSGDDLEEYERFSQKFPKLIKTTSMSSSNKSNDIAINNNNNLLTTASSLSSSTSSSSRFYGSNNIMNTIISNDSIMIIKDTQSIQGLIHYLLSNLHFDSLMNVNDLPLLYSSKPFLQSVCHRLKPSQISKLSSENNESTMKIDGLLSNDSFKKLCSVYTNVVYNNGILSDDEVLWEMYCNYEVNQQYMNYYENKSDVFNRNKSRIQCIYKNSKFVYRYLE